ncbi:MAG TPA: hypothetical protein VEX62_01870 [Candidatus Limnocylindrales bacterium]|nr:hypothetical protein [Candidatus Limnocylindrales bacterium]
MRDLNIGRLWSRGAMASPVPEPLWTGEAVPQAVALGVLALAHLFDYASFLVMVNRHGLGAEANPIVVMLAQLAGLPGLTIAKIVTVAFAAGLMILIAPHRKRLAMGLLVFGVGAGMVGGISNVLTLQA